MDLISRLVIEAQKSGSLIVRGHIESILTAGGRHVKAGQLGAIVLIGRIAVIR